MDTPSEQDYVKQFFGKGGLLSKAFAEYQPRASQIELAYAVDAAMREGEYLLAEAPTGTGKSLGYGVPASWYAAHRAQRVVIVTANIALQEQLVKKDLPLIQRVVPWNFKFALAKGINNYLCKSTFDDAINAMAFDGAGDNKVQWNAIVKWANSSLTGDLSELTLEPSPSLKQKFTTTSDECTGRKCSYYDECHAMRAKKEYKAANVVVTNYSLFFIDLVLRGGDGDGEGILPKYTHVIFDEGHKAADIARDHFGFSISPYAVGQALKMLDAPAGEGSKKGPMYTVDADLKKRATYTSDLLFDALHDWSRSKSYSIRIRSPLAGGLRELSTEMQTHLGAAGRAFREMTTDIRLTDERKLEMGLLAQRCERYSNSIGTVLNEDSFAKGDWVYFLEERGKYVSLSGKPVSVAQFLREFLFKEGQDKAKSDIKSVVVTSATLEMKLAQRQLGVQNPAELKVDSPFELSKQMLMVLPPMPDPTSPQYGKRLGLRLIEVLRESNGRALCLFTSYRVMEEAYAIVQDEELPFTLLKHGDAPRTQLIEQFKKDTNSVLFGTESFWAGVDVPGETLSVVTIDRIPFPNITDPVQDALKERHQRTYFFDYSVPSAMLQFRQGVGRLIRSVGDRGVFVCFDSRLLEKPYGKQFVKVFTSEGVEYTRDIQEIGSFLGTPLS